MAELFEIKSGKLSWGDELIENLSFEITIEADASISIRFDPLVFERPEERSEGWKALRILEDILLQRSRRVRKFVLSGRVTDGTEIETRHARLTNESSFDFGGPLTLKPAAVADELVLTYPASSEKLDEFDSCVQYLTKGQLGGVGGDAVTLPAGNLSFVATCKMTEAEDYYGSLCIEKKIAREDLGQWLEECDDVAERALHLLSLAQGRWYNWSARIIYRQEPGGSIKLYRCVRPREPRDTVRAHLFHHLNLRQPLRLLQDTYTRELINSTGIDTALLLMLTSTAYTEGRMWNQLVALEHLLTRFAENQKIRVVKSKTYNKRIKPLMMGALDQAVADGLIAGAESEEYKIFKGKIEVLNFPNMFAKFLLFVNHYRVPIKDLDSDDLKFLVVHCRNDLAHQGVPVSVGDDLDRLYLLADFAEELLNRVVMAMLKYEGQYVSVLDRLEHYRFSREGVIPLNPAPVE